MSVKERVQYEEGGPHQLTGEGLAFLTDVVDQAYGLPVPALGPRLTTSYTRSTLVDLEQGARVTIDLNLRWSDGQTRCAAEDLALVESKSQSGSAAVDVALARMGIRPVRLSKYCIGVALLNPDMAANRWNRLLVRHFGWQRVAETEPLGS